MLLKGAFLKIDISMGFISSQFVITSVRVFWHPLVVKMCLLWKNEMIWRPVAHIVPASRVYSPGMETIGPGQPVLGCSGIAFFRTVAT